MSHGGGHGTLSGEQVTSPLHETLAEVSDHARIGAVLGERGVGDLR
jgi:hypothetical protein